jgi:phosphoribosylglycinamide formyltransferase-1
MVKQPIQLAVLISGEGTTMQNLLNCIKAGSLNANIKVVVASRAECGGAVRAEKAGLKVSIVERKEYPDVRMFSQRVFRSCLDAKVELICLGGWLSLLEIPPVYQGRIINIHPALLPDFGGKGMYGDAVHQTVLERGMKMSGCTVHFVDQLYDHGPIILQRVCPVMPNDTVDSVALRVRGEENIAYPQAIRLFQEKRLKIEGNKVRILPK